MGGRKFSFFKNLFIWKHTDRSSVLNWARIVLLLNDAAPVPEPPYN
jgi:hypothetical protein